MLVLAATGARGLMNGGLSCPATGESVETETGSKREVADTLVPKPEIVFLFVSDPDAA